MNRQIYRFAISFVCECETKLWTVLWCCCCFCWFFVPWFVSDVLPTNYYRVFGQQ